jgi:hypothetical protein
VQKNCIPKGRDCDEKQDEKNVRRSDLRNCRRVPRSFITINNQAQRIVRDNGRSFRINQESGVMLRLINSVGERR